MVSHHPGKFTDHSHSGGGDIMVLIFRMTFQNHVIKKSCNFMEKSLQGKVSLQSAKVGGHRNGGSRV